MTAPFEALSAAAAALDPAFGEASRADCVEAARAWFAEARVGIQARHAGGDSGGNVVRALARAADTVLRGVFNFGLYALPNRTQALSRVSLCALGGYGRGELCPASDLDVCLLYEGGLDKSLEDLNEFLIPFLWDMGFDVGYALRGVNDAMGLVREDVQMFTSFLQARLVAGDNTAFARLKLFVRDLSAGERAAFAGQLRVREDHSALPVEHQDLYHTEPNVKDGAGGLRDFHTGLWLLRMTCGVSNLDDVLGQGLISNEEHIKFLQGLDRIWRIRNELHFHAGRADDRLTFPNQEHVARAFGYGEPGDGSVARLMEDYYAAARQIRRFLHVAISICDHTFPPDASDDERRIPPDYTIQNGELFVGLKDEHWFAESPARFMEAFWECSRYGASLSRPTQRMMIKNLDLIGDTFRSNDVVRRFFLAVCNRPLHAGHVLREMSNVGLLGRYIPEFAAVQGVIRYKDFHSFPVDEHTVRAVEALAALPEMSGPVAQCLNAALENLYDPYVLVLAILFHDLGKAAGEAHVEEGVRIVRGFCRRAGLPEEDEERVAFLVEHHMLMTTISQFRDVDDEETVRVFAATVKTSDRLRALFLLSYCDLWAVGPGVWNEWKGALLLKLYLRAEKVLLGAAETAGRAFWELPKAGRVAELTPPELAQDVEAHLRGLGERYFAAFAPEYIAQHIRCAAEARAEGLAVHCYTNEATNMSELVVCTQDRPGLFSMITGSFVSQLADVNTAALFTRPDGVVVDCFTLTDASRRRPLTRHEQAGIEEVLRAVLIKGEPVKAYVDQARRRLFALLQPWLPVPTRIEFDNGCSRTHTVVDVQTGDRTGLLYDVTRAMAAAGLDIATARIVTDARHVRDSFYVTRGGAKLEDDAELTAIRERLHDAIHPRAAAKL